MDHLVGKCPFGGVFRSLFCRRAAVKKHKNYRILLGNSGQILGRPEITKIRAKVDFSAKHAKVRLFLPFPAISQKSTFRSDFDLKFRLTGGTSLVAQILARPPDLDLLAQILSSWLRSWSSGLRSRTPDSDKELCWPHTYLVSAG